jgi:hypothetical protein
MHRLEAAIGKECNSLATDGESSSLLTWLSQLNALSNSSEVGPRMINTPFTQLPIRKKILNAESMAIFLPVN